MKKLNRVALVCVLAALAALLAVAQRPDLKGSKDHPLVTRYPGSVITDYAYSEFDAVMFPLGKANNQGQFDKSLRLEGKVTRIGYEAPAHRSILEIYRNYESALLKSGFQVLWSCINNDGCGGGPTQLTSYGGEDWGWGSGQRYLVAKSPRTTGDAYVSLHVGQWSDTERGAYVVLFVLEMKPMEGGLVSVDAKALGDSLATTGHVEVPGIFFDTAKSVLKPESDAALQEIAKLLQANPALKVWVVGHTDAVGSPESNMALSNARAAAVTQALTQKNGVDAKRLAPFGAGPYAPVASNDSEEGRAKNRRVELVKHL
jgi:outer membrane protein OmpA-like peptidoglycan-associated protein